MIDEQKLLQCVIENCENEIVNHMRGYCRAHYHKFRKYGDPEFVKYEAIKYCLECNKMFTTNFKFQRFCSAPCSHRERMKQPIEKMKDKIRKKAYSQTEKGKSAMIRSLRVERAKNYDKYLARELVRKHVLSGKIIKPTNCSVCKETTKLQAHHYKGYLKENRLDIVWLCNICHVQEHKRMHENLKVGG